MKKIEVHAKTKYSADYDSTIDVEALLYNALENNERGIIIVDKDSCFGFPKIDKSYKKLCEMDKRFNTFKVGYGVQLTSIIDKQMEEIIVLVKNQSGLKDLYKIISLYVNKYNKQLPFEEIENFRKNLFIGLMVNNTNLDLDFSKFDYLEINENRNISNFENNLVVYSNIPNSILPGEIKAKEVLYDHLKIEGSLETRLYLDTDESLKELDNEKIIIANSNRLFDNLESIIITSDDLSMETVDFEKFKQLVLDNYNSKKHNDNDLHLLEDELNLINELNYANIFYFLLDIINMSKSNKEYLEFDSYISNSLVAYYLGITIRYPNDLPYELFYSDGLNINIVLSPSFYYKKVFKFLLKKYENRLLRCNYGFKLKKDSICRMIKHYEIHNNAKLTLNEKDYIISILDDIPLYKESINNTFYLVPSNKEVEDFTPIELTTLWHRDSLKSTLFDYHDLHNSLFRVSFILNKDIETISNLMKATNKDIVLCNNREVYDLFRGTEAFKTDFKILKRKTGTLGIPIFSNIELENKLCKITNLWINDLEQLISKERGLVLDDIYNELSKDKDHLEIFSFINILKKLYTTIPKIVLENKVKRAYRLMYYKLYYYKEFYTEILKKYDQIIDRVLDYTEEEINDRYLFLINEQSLDIDTFYELELLEILVEMYERGIKYKISKEKIEVV